MWTWMCKGCVYYVGGCVCKGLTRRLREQSFPPKTPMSVPLSQVCVMRTTYTQNMHTRNYVNVIPSNREKKRMSNNSIVHETMPNPISPSEIYHGLIEMRHMSFCTSQCHVSTKATPPTRQDRTFVSYRHLTCRYFHRYMPSMR
jgi:hypothetical protein